MGKQDLAVEDGYGDEGDCGREAAGLTVMSSRCVDHDSKLRQNGLIMPENDKQNGLSGGLPELDAVVISAEGKSDEEIAKIRKEWK